jgi:hypothetical protein
MADFELDVHGNALGWVTEVWTSYLANPPDIICCGVPVDFQYRCARGKSTEVPR